MGRLIINQLVVSSKDKQPDSQWQYEDKPFKPKNRTTNQYKIGNLFSME